MMDVLRISAGLCLCVLLYLPLSYALCWWANLLDFRRRSGLFRWVAAWGWSFAAIPVLLYFSYWLRVRWAIVPAALVGMLVVARTRPRVRWRHLRWGFAAVLAVWALTLFAISEWTVGQRTFLSATAFDHSSRVAVTQELTETGVPPLNPFFAPGRPLPLFYYYFWYLTTSAVQVVSLGWVPARHAVTAGVMYTFLALLATVALSVWLLMSGRRRLGARRIQWAYGLLLVSGFDAAVYMLYAALAATLHWAHIWSTVEQWNEQVTNWMATALWVPHHTAAFVTGWLVYWESSLAEDRLEGVGLPLLVLRGSAVASIFGLSVWLGLLFGTMVGAWWALTLLRRCLKRPAEWVASAVAAGLLVLPFALELARAQQKAGAPLALGIRPFFPVERFFPWLDGLARSAGVQESGVQALHELAYLICLPLNYGLELGFLLVGAGLYYRYVTRGGASGLKGGMAWLPLLGVTAAAVTFVRSSVAQNDLGWRAFLPLQLGLLLMAVLGLEAARKAGWSPAWRRLVLWTGALGFATTTMDVVLMRFYPMARDVALGPEQQRAARTYSRVAAYRQLDRTDRGQYYVQHNPDVMVDFESGLLGHRRVVMADWIYGPLYGTDRETYQRHFDSLAPVFRQCGDGEQARAAAAEYQIRYWMFQRSDAVWREQGCWIWSATAVYRDENVLVVVARDGAIQERTQTPRIDRPQQ